VGQRILRASNGVSGTPRQARAVESVSPDFGQTSAQSAAGVAYSPVKVVGRRAAGTGSSGVSRSARLSASIPGQPGSGGTQRKDSCCDCRQCSA
jgi:hypothetical protein